MIKFIDANIFLDRWYTAQGREFTDSLDPEMHCTSVLVLAEVYHKLSKKNTLSAFEYIRGIMGAVVVFDITQDDFFNAMKNKIEININDKIHIAVMKRNNIQTIISYDTDFDMEKEIRREEV